MSLLRVSLFTFSRVFLKSLLTVSSVMSAQWANSEAAFSCLWACSKLTSAEKSAAIFRLYSRAILLVCGLVGPMITREQLACTPSSLCNAEISGVWIVFYQCRWSEKPRCLYRECLALREWCRKGTRRPTGEICHIGRKLTSIISWVPAALICGTALSIWRVFGSTTRVTRVTPTTWTSLPNTKNQRKCCPS